MKKFLLVFLLLASLFSQKADAAFPVTFGTLTGGNQPLSDFDQMFGVVGTMGQVMSTATGTNTIALTPNTNMPTISVYANYQLFGFVAANTTSGGVSINVSGVGALPAYASDGVTQLSNGSLVAGVYYIFAYNSALNSGGGGFQIVSAQPSTGSLTGPTVTKELAGSGTYTSPAGVIWLEVKMRGGGGGGAGSGSAGGGAGGNGADTTFGSSLLTASAGVGGVSNGAAGGLGGAFTVNSPALDAGSSNGGSGSASIYTSGGINGAGMGGSNCAGGAGSNGGGSAPIATAGAANTGGGGGAGASNVFNGSGGGAGACVDAIITSPSVTYAYAVGGGGIAGTAGGSGNPGAAGGSGGIWIIEHYSH